MLLLSPREDGLNLTKVTEIRKGNTYEMKGRKTCFCGDPLQFSERRITQEKLSPWASLKFPEIKSSLI